MNAYVIFRFIAVAPFLFEILLWSARDDVVAANYGAARRLFGAGPLIPVPDAASQTVGVQWGRVGVDWGRAESPALSDWRRWWVECFGFAQDRLSERVLFRFEGHRWLWGGKPTSQNRDVGHPRLWKGQMWATRRALRRVQIESKFVVT